MSHFVEFVIPPLRLPQGKRKREERSKDRPSLIKRSDPAIRRERLGKGAIFLRLSRTDDVKVDILPWRKIEKFGFYVTKKTGCLIPFSNSWIGRGQTGQRLGHLCCATTFLRRVEEHEREARNNEFGFPCALQCSHLCHLAVCCNPKHIVIEEQWKNLKRNYCGNGDGEVCDCGSEPPCIAPYLPTHVERKVMLLTYDSPELRDTIQASLPDHVSVRILARDHYTAEDLKRVNRNKRLRRGRKHKKQAKKNKKRREEKSMISSSSSSSASTSTSTSSSTKE